DPKEMEAVTTFYGVRDLSTYTEEFEPLDTIFVDLMRQNLEEETILVREPFGAEVDTSLYEVDVERGRIRAAFSGALPETMYSIEYLYNPVYYSPFMQGSPWIDPIIDTDIFDGKTLNFDNIWRTELDSARSGWNDPGIQYTFQLVSEPINLGDTVLSPIIFPANYEVRMSSEIVDTTAALFGAPAEPRKFLIYNTTGDYKVKYIHEDLNGDLYPSFPPGLIERVYILEKDLQGEFTIYTRVFFLSAQAGYSYAFQGGEILDVIQKFPFNRTDLFRLQTETPEIDQVQATNELGDIQVYPNPYIVSHKFEPPLPPNVTSGRGERRVYFSKIPQGARIHIFTARGEHVITLEDNTSIFNGTLIWNLKTKENLDIAYGVYFYVVDSPVGKKRGKLAVIK
ncbi:MAG: hypothetical protein KAJ16_01930, partial [Calditrichia bacterium]|nr:hypothetical protein [Calditrichia bacterium]